VAQLARSAGKDALLARADGAPKMFGQENLGSPSSRVSLRWQNAQTDASGRKRREESANAKLLASHEWC
jgi:hypothetical protein